MVQQTVQFESVSLSEVGIGAITAFLFSGATLAATLASIAENGALKGRYTGTVEDIAAGDYRLVVKFNGYTVSEPDEAVSLLIAVGTYVSKRLAVLNSETLRRFVTEDTGETEAADGSVAKLAQGAGGAGSADWTVEERAYILEQLALLTVSGASVVVTSGVYMCARGDVEQVYGNTNTATWADLNNNQDANEITSRINYHIAIADNYIRSVLTQGAWVMPVEGDTIPAILAYNCARLAGVLLYEGRGVSDYDSKGKPIHQLSHHKNGVDSFLKSVVYGSTDLSPLVKSSTNEAPTAS